MQSEAGATCVEPTPLDDIIHFKEPEYEGVEDYQLIIDKHYGKRSEVIAILLDIQATYNYLPKHILLYVAKSLDIPFSKLYSIATFYKAFSLKPRGKHIVTVCVGTACHVRGGARIAETISRELDIEPGETTSDKEFTLETVNCLGACALGPVVVVDGEYHGQVTSGKVNTIVNKYRTEEVGA